MKIYIDENISPYLGRALNELQKPLNKGIEKEISVIIMKEAFYQGVKDEEWIPKIGKEKDCVITQDLNIMRIRHQRELCEKNNLGLIFIKPPTKTGFKYWEYVNLLVKFWPEINKIVREKEGFFSYKITSKKIEEVG